MVDWSNMPYMTSIERLAKEERLSALRENITETLAARFGSVSAELSAELHTIEEVLP